MSLICMMSFLTLVIFFWGKKSVISKQMSNKKAKRQPNSIFCCLVTNVIMAFILTVSHINFFHENNIFPVPYQQSRFQLVPSPLRKFKAKRLR